MILMLGSLTVGLLATGFVLVCLFMMLVILIQKPKGGGLSGAFGGAGGGSAQAAFGAKTGDVLTWFTVICFLLFLLLSMGLQWTIRPAHAKLAATGQSTSSATPAKQGKQTTQTPQSTTSAKQTTQTAQSSSSAARQAVERAGGELPGAGSAGKTNARPAVPHVKNQPNLPAAAKPVPVVPPAGNKANSPGVPAGGNRPNPASGGSARSEPRD